MPDKLHLDLQVTLNTVTILDQGNDLESDLSPKMLFGNKVMTNQGRHYNTKINTNIQEDQLRISASPVAMICL